MYPQLQPEPPSEDRLTIYLLLDYIQQEAQGLVKVVHNPAVKDRLCEQGYRANFDPRVGYWILRRSR